MTPRGRVDHLPRSVYWDHQFERVRRPRPLGARVRAAAADVLTGFVLPALALVFLIVLIVGIVFCIRALVWLAHVLAGGTS